MASDEQPQQPSLPWRAGSTFIMGTVGILCRTFLMGLSTTEVHGLDEFLEFLDERKDIEGRERGLITVSNHISVMDDPILWGVLPLKYAFDVDNLRWGMGSYDLCFTNKGLSTFFSLGQLLPTHRSKHSEYGGLFQPTVTQAIRLLSRGPFTQPAPAKPDQSLSSPDLADPFTSGQLTYTTNGIDTFPAPSAYQNRRHAWIHIFPEGMIHQKEDKTMRYMKWGVSRLILESDRCPDVVPMWLEGLDDVMHESREFPRFIPRPFKNVSVTFGQRLDVEAEFGDLRRQWSGLKRHDERIHGERAMGELSDALKYSDEAVALRKECTLRVRNAVLKVRRTRGLPDEDPKAGLAETYALEGGQEGRRRDDGSIVRPE